MSDDTKDHEVTMASPRERRRTQRAKHRRGIRVPIDDVPRRSIADDSIPAPPVFADTTATVVDGPEGSIEEVQYDVPTDLTDIPPPPASEDSVDQIDPSFAVEGVMEGDVAPDAEGDEVTAVNEAVSEDLVSASRPPARVVVRGTVRVSDVPPALIESEFAVDEPTEEPSNESTDVHIEVAESHTEAEVDPEHDEGLVGAGAEWGSDEGDLLWREEQSRELRILEPTQDEAAQIAAAVEDESVEVELPSDGSSLAADADETGEASSPTPARPPPPPTTAGGLPPIPPAPEPAVGDSTEGVPTAKRRRPWFETFFNDDYLRTVPPPPDAHVRRQCDFIERSLSLERGATILDVGCGLGLHAVELSSRGYLVVGLDLSLPMLSRAADEAQDRGLKINFLHGDMREMSFDGAFDAVLCWGTTLGYFEDEVNKRVIERFYQALRPGGTLLVEVVNRDYVVRTQPNLVWFEGDGCVCMEETQYNYIKARLEVKRTVILDDGRQRETYYSIRLYAFHELGQLLHQQGFRVGSVSGHEAIPGIFFGADSPRMLVLAARRQDLGVRSPSARNLQVSTSPDTPPPPPPEGPLPVVPSASGTSDEEGDDEDFDDDTSNEFS